MCQGYFCISVLLPTLLYHIDRRGINDALARAYELIQTDLIEDSADFDEMETLSLLITFKVKLIEETFFKQMFNISEL
ncbi:MAG: hypothetical protein ACTHZ1_07365 [Sphingobacterium sp.]